MSVYISKEVEQNIRANLFESAEVLEERVLFFSATGKELKKKIKMVEDSAFEEFRGTSFGDRLKGAFNGSNSAKLEQAFKTALKGVTNLLKDGHEYGPVKRTRSSGDYTEIYYVYVVYGWFKDVFFKIEMETSTSSFWLNEMDKLKVPEEAIKIAFNIAKKENGELVIKKKAIYYINSGALLKVKEFGQRLYNECTYKKIPCKLSGSVVKF